MKYIYIRDTQGNQNLWEIIEENERSYTIQRCGTVNYIHIELCWEVDRSNILRTNIIIDFNNEESFGDGEWYAEHEKFVDCECFNCWMIGYSEENII